MDGVERVMVLGILAVIIAILSFAWNATEDGPLPAVLGGTNNNAIALSSHAPAAPVVVMPRPDIGSRLQDGERVAQDQDRLRNQLLGRAPEVGAPPFGANPVKGETQLEGPAGQFAQAQPPLNLPTLPGRGVMAPDVVSPVSSDGSPGMDAATDSERAADPADESLASLVPTYDSQGRRIEYEPVRLGSDPNLIAAGKSGGSGGAQPAAGSAGFKLYTVTEGDTLWNIATRHALGGDVKRTLERIQGLNPELDAHSLAVGRTIKLPTAQATAPAAPVVSAPALLAEGKTPAVASGNGRVYVVQDGDTLGEIARRELGDGRRWKDIYQLNRALIDDPENIRSGQQLVLPGS